MWFSQNLFERYNFSFIFSYFSEQNFYIILHTLTSLITSKRISRSGYHSIVVIHSFHPFLAAIIVPVSRSYPTITRLLQKFKAVITTQQNLCTVSPYSFFITDLVTSFSISTMMNTATP